MDSNKIAACKSKFKTLDEQGRISCLYQWVLTKNVKINEFAYLVKWLGLNKPGEPEVEVPTET